jgi:flavin reductase (DIM6/NTAB) family NADH-FMN oxidoreductase RutF
VDDQTKALYRRALGAFPTGVAVVTAPDGQGGAAGLTVNSFTSVSLDPPLVAWSLGAASDRGVFFREAERFVLNILGADDAALAAELARRGQYKVDPARLAGDPPGIASALSRLTCRTHRHVTLGDHILIVGEVTAFEAGDGDALTYFRGRYGRAVAAPG